MGPFHTGCLKLKHIHILFSAGLLLVTSSLAGAGGVWITRPASDVCSGLLMSEAHESANFRSSLKKFPLLAEFSGEVAQVRYRSVEERSELRAYLGLRNVRLRQKDGFFDLVGTGIRAMYVVDVTGEIYLDPDDRGPHSGILAGAPVAGAGYMTFNRDGTITIDNSSGHYKPDRDSLIQVARLLISGGFDISRINLKWFSSDISKF